MGYDEAVRELYQAPLAQFVAERKRLAGELKTAGDKSAAAELGKRARPTISAWAVNQLWWHARDAFEALLATADKLRAGDIAATTAHRDAIAKLRARAARMLEDADHSATESVLRRVTGSLAAIAANGWEPDAPGTLAADRDPPGFEAVGAIAPRPAPAPAKQHDGHHRKHDAHADLERERARAEAEERERKRREEAERTRAKAERHRLEAALRTAKGDVATRERELRAAEKQVEAAQKAIEKAKQVVDDLEDKLRELGD